MDMVFIYLYFIKMKFHFNKIVFTLIIMSIRLRVVKHHPPTVVHLKRKNGVIVQDCDLYIGRHCSMGGWTLPGSKWANPFSIKQYGTRDEVCRLYEQYIRNNTNLYNSLHELSGLRLGCWCKPELCHGDVLVKLFNEVYN